MAGRGSVYGRVRPTFQPIVSGALTDEEKRRLERIAAVYPFIEWTATRQQMNRLILERHIWRNGDEQ